MTVLFRIGLTLGIAGVVAAVIGAVIYLFRPLDAPVPLVLYLGIAMILAFVVIMAFAAIKDLWSDTP